jgi:hypothetical protein
MSNSWQWGSRGGIRPTYSSCVATLLAQPCYSFTLLALQLHLTHQLAWYSEGNEAVLDAVVIQRWEGKPIMRSIYATSTYWKRYKGKILLHTLQFSHAEFLFASITHVDLIWSTYEQEVRRMRVCMSRCMRVCMRGSIWRWTVRNRFSRANLRNWESNRGLIRSSRYFSEKDLDLWRSFWCCCKVVGWKRMKEGLWWGRYFIAGKASWYSPSKLWMHEVSHVIQRHIAQTLERKSSI